MKYIIIPETEGEIRQAPFYFAVEEYVAHHYLDDEYFFIWQVPPTVLLGRNQLTEGEVDTDFCRQVGISIYRRKSGGGCVFTDEGCLQFSYIVADNNVSRVFRQYMQQTADTLSAAGIRTDVSGRNDIMVGRRKVGGAAFYQTGDRSVMHNTLLYHTDLTLMERAITPRGDKLISKGVLSVKERVGNVGDHTSMSMSDFISKARETICSNLSRRLTDDDLREIRKIETHLASEEFVYGNNPRYTMVKRCHIPEVGYIEAYIEMKNDVIRDVNLMGDFFLVGDLDRNVLSKLRGVAYRREDVASVIATLPLGDTIRNMDKKRFLSLLFGRDTHVKKPDWLRIQLSTNRKYRETQGLIEGKGVHTICQSGLCPNRTECWRSGTATLMIGGNICTRNCRFCNTPSGRPLPIDPDEPRRIAELVKEMGLRHAVITSVDRDDLPDLGASHWVNTILAIRDTCPNTCIEVLIPDFMGRTELIDKVLDAKPDIVGHNMETIRRLTPIVRSVAQYEQSLGVLRDIAQRGYPCKTGFMVGLGETEDEVWELMKDIRTTGCTILTIGQYLQPTARHIDVAEYIHPTQFAKYKDMALKLGYTHVESGPLVRSSYHAEQAVKSKDVKQ